MYSVNLQCLHQKLVLYHSVSICRYLIKRQNSWDFPGGPMAKTPCSQHREPGFSPWSGNDIDLTCHS